MFYHRFHFDYVLFMIVSASCWRVLSKFFKKNSLQVLRLRLNLCLQQLKPIFLSFQVQILQHHWEGRPLFNQKELMWPMTRLRQFWYVESLHSCLWFLFLFASLLLFIFNCSILCYWLIYHSASTFAYFFDIFAFRDSLLANQSIHIAYQNVCFSGLLIVSIANTNFLAFWFWQLGGCF
jgi:hypothetical protein